jgi:hypothetical protein
MSHMPTPTPVPTPTTMEAKMIAAQTFLLTLSFMHSPLAIRAPVRQRVSRRLQRQAKLVTEILFPAKEIIYTWEPQVTGDVGAPRGPRTEKAYLSVR